MKAYRLNERVGTRLKHPLGSLIIGSPERTMVVLGEAIKRERPTKLCVVGDSITLRTIEHGIRADLYVVDNKIMRKPVGTPLPNGIKVFKASNPPGTITSEAWEVLEKIADRDERLGVVVDGEEDLLTLPVIKFAPIGSFVVYGQPYVGIVLVRVGEEKKREIDEIMGMMDKDN